VKISRGIEIIKLETWLTPKCAPADTKNAPAKKAGSAEIISDLAPKPGSTQPCRSSQVVQFVVSAAQEGAIGVRGFKGSESKRMDDHQKYR
jgi:hypothetical protein